MTARMWAASEGHMSVVKLLLKQGAPDDIQRKVSLLMYLLCSKSFHCGACLFMIVLCEHADWHNSSDVSSK